MTQRLRRWLRVVLPIDQLAYLVLFALLLLIAIQSIRGFGPADKPATWQILIVLGTTLLYAAFRCVYFHPVENRRYGNWLMDSPWRYPKLLPLGPLHLVWQDVVLVAIWSALLPAEMFTRWTVPIMLLLAYCFGIGFTLCRMGIYRPVYVMGFFLGAFILALPSAIWCMVAALAIYAPAYWGIQLLLKRLSDGEAIPQYIGLGLPTGHIEPLLGWPVPPVPTERYRWSITQADAIQFAAFVGWLFFCIAWQGQDATGVEDGLRNTLGLITVLAVLARVLNYVVGYLPPVSFLGRILTWRWIIPGYDKVLVAPLAALIAAGVLPMAVNAIGLPSIVAYPLAAGVVVWLTLALPPSRSDWQLTGRHRIAYRLRAAYYQKSAASRMIPRTN
jgi:hypothetical protein